MSGSSGDVAVTGLGVVSPHGDDPAAMFEALWHGRSALAPIFPELPKPAAAALAPFDFSRWFTRLQLAGVDRVSQLAVGAADLAIRDAFGDAAGTGPSTPAGSGSDHGASSGSGNGASSGSGSSSASSGSGSGSSGSGSGTSASSSSSSSGAGAGTGFGAIDVDPERVGVYVGCGMGGASALEAAYRSASGRVPPLTIPAFMPNAPAAHIAMRNRVLGPVLTYSMACASSAVAIAEAAKAVQCGEVDVAIAGGSEALIVPGVILAWQAMQTLGSFPPGEAARAVRPFAIDRSGFALGEGAAFLILESSERARRRAARVYATLAGWGLTSDATHLTKPDAPGQARALRQALRRADLPARDIGYCNAHGTATRIGDVVERDALADVWGADLERLRVSSTKALHGHLLGAAGALEAVVTVLALHRQALPPNAHCSEIDPACRMNLVLEAGTQAARLEAAISNSFAFGGVNSVLLFRGA